MLRVLIFIKMNANRKTLDYLYVITAGVLRRKKTEERSCSPSHFFDRALVIFAERINVNSHRLTRSHQAKLSLFVIRSDPNVVNRHDD
jgi:hypothetical protein